MRGYVIWIVAAFFVMYQFSLQISVGVMSQPLQEDLGVGAGQIGILTAVFAVAYASMQVPVGVLLDRLNARWMMGAAILICALGVLLFASSESIAVAAFARLVMGLSAAFAFVGTGVLASRWMPASRFALFIGLTEMSGMLGAAGASSLLAALLEAVSWRQLMFAAGLFGLMLAVVFVIVVRDRPDQPPTEDDGRSAATTPRLNLQEAIGEVATSKAVWLSAVFYGLTLGVAFSFAGLWDIPFLQAFDRDLAEATHANAFIFFGLSVGTVLAGWLSDRLGRRRVILQWAMAGATVMMCFVLYTPKMPVLVVWPAMFLLGLFLGSIVLSFAMAADRSSPAARGTAIGLVNTFGFVGVTLLQIMSGMLIATDTTPQVNEYRVALTIFPVALVGAFVLTFFMERTGPGSSAAMS